MFEKVDKKFALQAILLVSTSLLALYWDNGWVLFWGFVGSQFIDD